MQEQNKMRSIRIATNLERIVIYIQNNVHRARAHLKEHVTIEGKIISLDMQCEYCKIHFMAKEVYFS